MSSARISVKEASELLEVTQQFLRIALQQKKYPFGFALKLNGSNNYTYFINREALMKYIKAE